MDGWQKVESGGHTTWRRVVQNTYDRGFLTHVELYVRPSRSGNGEPSDKWYWGISGKISYSRYFGYGDTPEDAMARANSAWEDINTDHEWEYKKPMLGTK